MSRNLDLVRLLAQRNAPPVAAAPAKSSSSAPPVTAAAASRSSPAVVSPSAGSGGNSTQTASKQSGPCKSDGDSKQRLLSIYGRSAQAPKPKGAPKAKPEAVPKAPQPKLVTKPKESESTKTGGPGLKRPAGRVLKRPASREMSNESDPPLKRPAAQCDSDQPDDDMQNEDEESEGPHTGSSSGYSGQTPIVMFLKVLLFSLSQFDPSFLLLHNESMRFNGFIPFLFPNAQPLRSTFPSPESLEQLEPLALNMSKFLRAKETAWFYLNYLSLLGVL